MTDANTKEQETFVIDTSFVLAYLLPDEKERSVEETFVKFEENKISFIAPYLLTYEVLNGLRSAVLQKRQSVKTAKLLLHAFLNLGIIFEKTNEKDVLQLALDRDLSAYDASYVWLAKNKNIMLLTLDEGLQKF